MNCKIPKHFHFIWLGGNLSEEYASLQEKWKTLHPTFKFTLWSEKELEQETELMQELEKIRQVYEQDDGTVLPLENITFAVFSDIIRYYLLFKYGGIYVDTDTECVRPIDDLVLLCENTKLTLWNGSSINDKLVTVDFNNNFIISKKNNNIFKILFDESLIRTVKLCEFYKNSLKKTSSFSEYKDFLFPTDCPTSLEKFQNFIITTANHQMWGKFGAAKNPAAVAGPWWILFFLDRKIQKKLIKNGIFVVVQKDEILLNSAKLNLLNMAKTSVHTNTSQLEKINNNISLITGQPSCIWHKYINHFTGSITRKQNIILAWPFKK